jgi:hypothetical protein
MQALPQSHCSLSRVPPPAATAATHVAALLQVVYVLQANDEGQIVTPLPGADSGMQLQRSIEWLLVDGMTVSSALECEWA